MNGLEQCNCVINLPHLWHPPRALSVGSYGESHYEKTDCGREPAEYPSVTSLMFQGKGNHLRVSSVNQARTHTATFALIRHLDLQYSGSCHLKYSFCFFFSSTSVDFCGQCCHV